MPDLWQRSWSLTIGRLRLSSAAPIMLDVEFKVEKDTTSKPNKISAKAYNLSEQHREQIGTSAEVELRAGYVGNESTLFVGQARSIWTERNGPDLVTVLEGEDAGTGYRGGAVSRAFSRGSTPEQVARLCVEAMGIGDGNLRELASERPLAQGYTAQGPAHRVLTDIARAYGMTWSVQDGALQLRRRGPVETRAILLTPSTGLVGSPARQAQTTRGAAIEYKAKALLIPGLYPGRVVRIESSILDASLEVKRVTYSGQSAGTEWYADLVLTEW